MWELTAENVADYLLAAGRIAPSDRVQAEELAGGVSSAVIRVRVVAANGASCEMVVKQARGRLRVAREWLCSVERSWRELDVLAVCERLLPAAGLTVSTPRVLWEDRPNYLFAMTAAPRGSRTWKDLLLAGETDPRIARACGAALARLHGGSWRDAKLATQLGDRGLFDALRLDPYYRAIAAVHVDLAPQMDRLIASVARHASSLVHADFSPKHLLVYIESGKPGLMMVDFETGHYGDGAFDVGFLLTHLVLKAFYFAPRHAQLVALAHEFWSAYRPAMTRAVGVSETAALEARGMQHLAACSLARLDGKSPVEYLTDDVRRDAVRHWCRAMLHKDIAAWPDAAALVARFAVR